MRATHVIAAVFLALPGAAMAQYPTSPPPPAPLRPAAFPPFQEAVLPNGMRLVVVESHRQPVVSLSLAMPAGSRYAPPGREGLAELVATLLTKGAGNRSAEESAAAIEGVGGSLIAGVGTDFFMVGANILTPDTALAFELMSDAVMRPAFVPEELELARTQTLSALQLELSQPGSIAERIFAREIYGRHPYARRATPESVQRLTRADLVAFQTGRLRPGGALLVISGDITLAQARRLALRAFGRWTGTPPASARLPAPPIRARQEIVLVHRPGSVQSNIVIGNTTFPATDPRYYAALVANQVVGGGAAARLYSILSEEKSWTYGAFSGLSRPRGIGTFQASAEVRTEVTDSALREMLSQLRRIGTETVPVPELDAAKEALTGRFPLTIETAGQIATAVSNARLLGLPADYLRTYRTRLGAVSPANVRSVAPGVVRPAEALIVVVGDAEKVHESLRRIAPVRLVTPDGKPLDVASLGAATATLPFDVARLTSRHDSLAVLVQGNAMGFQTAVLEKTANGFAYVEETRIGTIAQQRTTLTLDARGGMIEVKQSGTVQGQATKIDVAYSGGRARGTATTPTTGMKEVAIDTAFAAGTLDDNAILAVLPGLAWADGARWTFPVFSSGKGATDRMTLAVSGSETVTVPAGTFETYRATLTGGQAPLTLFVTKGVPHRVVKMTVAGAPIEFQLVK